MYDRKYVLTDVTVGRGLCFVTTSHVGACYYILHCSRDTCCQIDESPRIVRPYGTFADREIDGEKVFAAWTFTWIYFSAGGISARSILKSLVDTVNVQWISLFARAYIGLLCAHELDIFVILCFRFLFIFDIDISYFWYGFKIYPLVSSSHHSRYRMSTKF